MILRPYQQDASDAIFREWGTYDSTLAVLPTGTGKTVLFASVIARVFPRRAIVLAHRTELIQQACDKIHAVTGLKCEVEMGDQQANESGLFGSARVIVSTIQTQCSGGDGGGRMAKFDPARFGALIIDECHHSASASYKRVINYYRTNPHLKVLGVTATPDRADEEALGQVFQSVAYEYEIIQAIKDGWLVPIQQQMVHVAGLDFTSVHTTAGDLNNAELSAIMEHEDNMQKVVSSSIEIIGQRRAIGFTASVAQAEMAAEICNRHRPGMAAWICGKTDKDDRKKILSDFASGQIQIVWNCGVLTEGFDDSGVEVIIMARPTKSRSLYAQMAGRGTRPISDIAHTLNDCVLPEARAAMIANSRKPSCLVVDFVGNCGRHKLVSVGDILGGNVTEEIVAAAVERAKKSGKPMRMDEAIAEEEAAAIEAAEKKRIEDESKRARLVAKARFTTQSVDPFDAFDLKPVSDKGWDTGKQLSDKQRSMLLKQGLDPDALPYAQAKQVINELFHRWNDGLCSLKQASILKKHGYPTSVTREAASATIDLLAKNGWKRPAQPITTLNE